MLCAGDPRIVPNNKEASCREVRPGQDECEEIADPGADAVAPKPQDDSYSIAGNVAFGIALSLFSGGIFGLAYLAIKSRNILSGPAVDATVMNSDPANDNNAVPKEEQSGIREIPKPVENEEQSGVREMPKPAGDGLHEKTKARLVDFMRLTKSENLGDPDELAHEASTAWEKTGEVERGFYLHKERMLDPQADASVPPKMWLSKFLMNVRMRASDIPVDVDPAPAPVSDEVRVDVADERPSTGAESGVWTAPPVPGGTPADPMLLNKLALQISSSRSDVTDADAAEMAPAIYQRYMQLQPEVREALLARGLLDVRSPLRMPADFVRRHFANGQAQVVPQEWLNLEIDRGLRLREVGGEIGEMHTVVRRMLQARNRLERRGESPGAQEQLSRMADQGAAMLKALREDYRALERSTPEMDRLMGELSGRSAPHSTVGSESSAGATERPGERARPDAIQWEADGSEGTKVDMPSDGTAPGGRAALAGATIMVSGVNVTAVSGTQPTDGSGLPAVDVWLGRPPLSLGTRENMGAFLPSLRAESLSPAREALIGNRWLMFDTMDIAQQLGSHQEFRDLDGEARVRVARSIAEGMLVQRPDGTFESPADGAVVPRQLIDKALKANKLDPAKFDNLAEIKIDRSNKAEKKADRIVKEHAAVAALLEGERFSSAFRTIPKEQRARARAGLADYLVSRWNAMSGFQRGMMSSTSPTNSAWLAAKTTKTASGEVIVTEGIPVAWVEGQIAAFPQGDVSDAQVFTNVHTIELRQHATDAMNKHLSDPVYSDLTPKEKADIAKRFGEAVTHDRKYRDRYFPEDLGEIKGAAAINARVTLLKDAANGIAREVIKDGAWAEFPEWTHEAALGAEARMRERKGELDWLADEKVRKVRADAAEIMRAVEKGRRAAEEAIKNAGVPREVRRAAEK